MLHMVYLEVKDFLAQYKWLWSVTQILIFLHQTSNNILKIAYHILDTVILVALELAAPGQVVLICYHLSCGNMNDQLTLKII